MDLNTSSSQFFLKKYTLTWLFSLTVLLGISQEASINGVLFSQAVNSVGIIKENEIVVGHYVFYKKSKADSENYLYEIKIFDPNYLHQTTIPFTHAMSSFPLEVACNNEVFLLCFIDKKKGLEFLTFDLNGKQLGEEIISKEQIDKVDFKQLMLLSKNGNSECLVNVGNLGFVFKNNIKINRTAELICFDNSLNEKWKYKLSLTKSIAKEIEILDISEDIITCSVDEYNPALPYDYDQKKSYYLVIDSRTGNVLSDLKLNDETEKFKSVSKIYKDTNTNSLTVVGEYYNSVYDFKTNKSQGLFIENLSNEGKTLSLHEYSWDKEIAAFMKENEMKDENAVIPFSLFIHDIIMKNGHVYLIGEQYRKQLNAGAITLNTFVSSDISNLKIEIGDLVFIEVDSMHSLTNYYRIEKENRFVTLEKEWGMKFLPVIGEHFQAKGLFDFLNFSFDEGNHSIQCVYFNGERKENNSTFNTTYELNTLNIFSDKLENKSQKLVLNTHISELTPSKKWWIHEAKSGYVSVSNYVLNENSFKLQLFKL